MPHFMQADVGKQRVASLLKSDVVVDIGTLILYCTSHVVRGIYLNSLLAWSDSDSRFSEYNPIHRDQINRQNDAEMAKRSSEVPSRVA